ncbi:hypothetical protein IFM89_022064 [Coptis chinensis]|uniref:Major facilitator superfamily (MFS) profile domain-containing protein n=1 Tax=Coptis chinensis TaxID=261450 RepID=A0A835LG16_9MAGN|nr:hypothetical protein IFM89_022064 [Coptis chinensis]
MDCGSRRWRYAYSLDSTFGEMESAKIENCGIELLTLVIHSGEFASMAPFLKKFCPSVYRKENGDKSTNQYGRFDSVILTLVTSSLYLAALIAFILASKVTRTFGRKLSMLLGGLVFLVGAISNCAAKNVAMLSVDRLLLGVGVGFSNQSVPLYVSDMVPYKYRGALNIGFQLSTIIGILAANLINYFTDNIKGGWGWRFAVGALIWVKFGVNGVANIGSEVSFDSGYEGSERLVLFEFGCGPLLWWSTDEDNDVVSCVPRV